MGDEADPSIGDERVKQKASDIQQEYRIAVTQGTISGSSRVVCENWEQLKNLWGRSAAAVCLTNCRTAISHAEKQSEFNDHNKMN